MCTSLKLMIWTLCVTLTFAAVQVAPDKVLRNIFRRFGSVVNSIESVWKDYTSETFFPVEVADDMIYNL